MVKILVVREAAMVLTIHERLARTSMMKAAFRQQAKICPEVVWLFRRHDLLDHCQHFVYKSHWLLWLLSVACKLNFWLVFRR